MNISLHVDCELELELVRAKVTPEIGGKPGYCVDFSSIRLSSSARARIEALYAEEICKAAIEQYEAMQSEGSRV